MIDYLLYITILLVITPQKTVGLAGGGGGGVGGGGCVCVLCCYI